MEFKKSKIGASVFVKKMGRSFKVNAANKELLLKFGPKDIFEDEPTDKKGATQSDSADASGKKRSAGGKQLSVSVHERSEQSKDSDADTANVK